MHPVCVPPTPLLRAGILVGEPLSPPTFFLRMFAMAAANQGVPPLTL